MVSPTDLPIGQGVAVILLGGALGGLGHGLATGILGLDHPWQMSLRNVALGIIAAVIAFGVTGVSSSSVWQQLSTCTIAGVGGGEIIRSYMKGKQLQTTRGKADEAIDTAEELVDDPNEPDDQPS
jgi:hypothetical protein